MNVIIIGSGIVGATTAYYLSKNGVDVTLIDRNEPGRATDAAAGIICPWLAQRRNQSWYTLARKGAKFYPKLIEQLASDGETNTGYAHVGAVKLHTIEQRLTDAVERIRKRKIDAPEIGDITVFNEQETAQNFSLLKDGSYHSIHISGAARIDGELLRKSLVAAAIKHGTKTIQGNASLIANNKHINEVEVDGKLYQADYIIAANGAWMKQLFSPVGIELMVHPQKGQIIHLEIDKDTNSWPIIIPPNNQYILPFNKNKLIIGATREAKSGFDERITAGGVLEVLTNAIEIAPELANSTLKKIKMGFRPFTPNSLPIIGHIPRQKNVLLANGLGASGLTTGPFIGTQLAKTVLDQHTDIDLSHYKVNQIVKDD